MIQNDKHVHAGRDKGWITQHQTRSWPTSPQRLSEVPGSARFRFQTRVRSWEQKGRQHDDPSGDDLCHSGR